MPVLFTANWDIISGKEGEYASFLPQTYLPEMAAMDLPCVGGYYVEAGFGPRIIGVHTCSDLQMLAGIISSKRFKSLIVQLKSMVTGYRTAMMEPTGHVKREEYTIQKGAWKFNQYYDLRPGKKAEYSDYVINVHVPTLQKLDYLEVTGGWNVPVGGVSEILAEFTFKDPIDIGRLLNNEDFRKITMKLKTDYVVNYQSRILRSTERFEEKKWFYPI